MRKALASVALLSLVVMMAGSGCILDEKVEMVFTHQYCLSFEEYRTSPDFSVTRVCDGYGDKILDYLEEGNIAPEDVKNIHVVSGSYKVTKLSDRKEDWTISGHLLVDRRDDAGNIVDGPETLLNYTEQPLLDAQGTKVPADLNSDGVDVLNSALWDFIQGDNPILSLTLMNGEVDPEPTENMPLEFKYHACVVIQIVADVMVDGDDDDS
jgi:hypothetical protein